MFILLSQPHFKASKSEHIHAEEVVRSAWGRAPRRAPSDSNDEGSREGARARAHKCDQKLDCYARILEPFVDQTDGILVDYLSRCVAACYRGGSRWS